MSMTENDANIALCNQALDSLGADNIVKNGSSQNHTYCTTMFDDARDEILTAHKWNFAKKRAFAIQTTDPLFGYDNAFTPPSDYLKVWQIEEEPDAEFEVENALILTDEGTTPTAWASGEDYLAGEYIQSDDSGSDLTYLVNIAFTSTSTSETTDLSTYCTSQGGDYQVLKVEYIYQHSTLGTWPVYAKQCFVINLARMLSSPIKQNETAALNLQAMLYGSKKVTGYLDVARSIDAREGGAIVMKTNTWIGSRK
jgi:hypothetical protein